MAVSPIYNTHTYKWLKCVGQVGASAYGIIKGIISWAKNYIKNNPKVATLLGDAAEGGAEAISLGGFFSVAVLAMGVTDWLLAATAVGITAWAAFEAVRCAQDAVDG